MAGNVLHQGHKAGGNTMLLEKFFAKAVTVNPVTTYTTES